MKRSFLPRAPLFPMEALETRIAPANIINVGSPNPAVLPPGAFSDVDYTDADSLAQDAFFIDTEKDPTDPISSKVGGGLAGTGGNTAPDTFYLRLSGGDTVKLFNGTNGFDDFIIVKGGNVVAFFIDTLTESTGESYTYNSTTGQAVVTHNNFSSGRFLVGDTVRFDPTGGPLSSLNYADYAIVAKTTTTFTIAVPGAFTTGTGTASIFGRDNEIQAQELVGLALGKGASLEVKGSVLGDIVTNLDELGTPLKGDDTLQMTGLVSSKQNFAALTIGANVSGGIYSGGAITNLEIKGSVKEVLAGSAANGRTFDFFPNVVGGNGTLAVTTVPGEAGPGISKVRIDSLVGTPAAGPVPEVPGRIQAGDGGAGAAGGSLANIQILEDINGFTLQAGKGGDGAGAKAAGGAGGAVTTVHIAGIPDALRSPNGIVILSGDGGDGLTTAKGGAGGKMSSIFVGFELSVGKTLASGDSTADTVSIRSGTGGDGKTAGAGGSMNDIRVTAITPEGAGNEIEVIAGAGGTATNTTTGKAGAGGTILKTDLQNQNTGLFADIELRAGNAGGALGAATGAAGGSINTAVFVGSEVKVVAGNGSTGKVGGPGGSVTSLLFKQRDTIVTNKLLLDAGFGGDGADGSGAKGGDINGVRIEDGDFSLIQINAGTAADGGDGLGPKGGKGGSGGKVTAIDIIDRDTGRAFDGTFTLRSGNGGLGKTGGGSGGAIDKVTFFADNLAPTITAGNGGDATTTGNAGNGGLISILNISASDSIGVVGVSGIINAGVGGNGLATKTKGGAGGDLRTVEINTDFNVTLTAGNGGNGGTEATPGKGGSIFSSAGFARDGSGILTAGNGGATGLKAAVGGSILGTAAVPSSLRALTNLTINAGNGTHGGAGGAIKFFNFGSTAASLAPTPAGSILVRAGDGSAELGVAGAGGSIDSVTGNPTSNFDPILMQPVFPSGKFTRIIAGAGGGSATATKSGPGGSVSNLTLFGVGDDLVDDNKVFIVVEAGHAGASPLATSGGTGGSVKAVSAGNLDPDAVFRSVAAGDGGAGTAKGGNGGSLDGVFVIDHDLGVRSGATYGYSTMGGVFAGAAGTGTKTGLAGSVKNISANAIAAIVAGRAPAPQLVEKVERVSVTGVVAGLRPDENALLKAAEDLVNPDDGGDPRYANVFFDTGTLEERYSAAALVGAMVNPTGFNADGTPNATNGGLDGNKFHFTNVDASVDLALNPTFTLGDIPIDGLIAARVFVQSSVNFIPEASFITTDLGKALTLFDIREKVAGTVLIPEVQTYVNPGVSSYTLHFDGDQTGVLPAGASTTLIQTALNALASITAAGGVTVTAGNAADGEDYIVTFNTAGVRDHIALQNVAFFDHDNLV